MEFFWRPSNQPLETCLEEVISSDIIVIVVIGHRIGLFSGKKKSYTVLNTKKPKIITSLAWLFCSNKYRYRFEQRPQACLLLMI
jgi:hypothetical protein